MSKNNEITVDTYLIFKSNINTYIFLIYLIY